MFIVLAEAYLHGLDPFAIKFPAGWPLAGLRWYGLAYLAGFAVAWLMVDRLARTHRTAIPVRMVPDMMIYILVGVLIGGRLGYCVFYDPELLLTFGSKFPYWGLLEINKGGMASHGGILGVIAALWIFAVKNHMSKLHLLDVSALICPPGLFFGRLANFVNAELWGRVLPPDRQAEPPWWSVKYPQAIREWSSEDLARLSDAVQSVGLSSAEWRDALARRGVDGDADVFVEVTVNRLIAAIQDGNEQVIESVRPLLEAYYPSQILQAVTDGPLLLAILVLAWWGPRKPGVVGAWFLMGYGVLRMLSERFRQPDAGVALLATPLGDLSRGQVLSALMVLAGVVGLLIVARREVEPIGGLIRTSESEPSDET